MQTCLLCKGEKLDRGILLPGRHLIIPVEKDIWFYFIMKLAPFPYSANLRRIPLNVRAISAQINYQKKLLIARLHSTHYLKHLSIIHFSK